MRGNIRGLVGIPAVVVAIMCAPGAAQQAFAQLKEVTGAYCAATAAMGVTFVARDSGAFQKFGLAAKLSLVETSQQIAGVTAGRITFGACTADAVTNAILQGAKVKLIALIVPVLQGQIWSVPSVTSASELRGKIVGAWGPANNIVTYTMRYALQKMGLDPDKDVQWRKFNTTVDLFAALASGQIQAAPVYVPDNLRAKQQGLHLLYDTLKDNEPYPSASIYVRRDADPKMIDALVKALVVGTHEYKTKPDLAVESLMRELQLKDRSVAVEAQRFFASALPDVPMWTDDYMKVTLRILAQTRPDAMKANPRDLYDNSYFQALIDSGFIKQVWGR